MRFTISILITALCTTSFAAEKIPLQAFIDDIRNQLYDAGANGSDSSKPLDIKNIRLELNIIVETDEYGNTGFYVIEDADSRGMVTQKLYFDVVLPANGAPSRSSQGYRSYSTNKTERRYAPDCYVPYRRQPCYRLHDRYNPEILPIIVPNHSR